ncbi:MAG: hypothetical protein DMG59_14725 [Acidobacteria bacterium]|nr:MAG: hypothetical protein DMG59_14725 [Acidobacteriota bacterium]
MKLRLHSNTLRLRLSQSEVSRLAESGQVQETITFAPGQTFSYSIEARPEAEVGALLESNRVRIVLPAAVAKNWMESDQTGVEGSTATLRVVVEKDYQCLHRESEEDADAFPNPLKQKS